MFFKLMSDCNKSGTEPVVIANTAKKDSIKQKEKIICLDEMTQFFISLALFRLKNAAFVLYIAPNQQYKY